MLNLAEPGSTALNVYLRRFHESALDCCNPVSENMPVRFYLHDMTEEYRVPLENLSFPFFAKLMEAARGPTSPCEGPRNLTWASGPIQLSWGDEHRKGGRSSWQTTAKGRPDRHIRRNPTKERKIRGLPPLPCNEEKATALLEQWVKDRVVCLPWLLFDLRRSKSRKQLPVSPKKWHNPRAICAFQKVIWWKTQIRPNPVPKRRDYWCSQSCVSQASGSGERSCHDGLPLQRWVSPTSIKWLNGYNFL